MNEGRAHHVEDSPNAGLDYAEIPAPEGFELRITSTRCDDETCSNHGCVVWLHWLSPKGEDSWLMISATEQQPQFGRFTEIGTANYFTRFCIAVGVSWDTLLNAKVPHGEIGLKQIELVRAVPALIRQQILDMPIEQLRVSSQEGSQLAGMILDGELSLAEADQLLNVDAERPL